MRCPTCKADCGNRPSPFAPFCSERCKLADLGRWLNEEFRIPGDPTEPIHGREDVEDEDEDEERVRR